MQNIIVVTQNLGVVYVLWGQKKNVFSLKLIEVCFKIALKNPNQTYSGFQVIL